jgi:hypothetical protein
MGKSGPDKTIVAFLVPMAQGADVESGIVAGRAPRIRRQGLSPGAASCVECDFAIPKTSRSKLV